MQLILDRPLFRHNTEEQMIHQIQQFQRHLARFKGELARLRAKGQSIDEYQPKWTYLKLLKRVYQFSPEMYQVVTNLLHLNPKKRRNWLNHTMFDQYRRTPHPPQATSATPTTIGRYRLSIQHLDIDLVKFRAPPAQRPKTESLYLTAANPTDTDMYDDYDDTYATMVRQTMAKTDWSSFDPVPDNHLDLVIQTMRAYTKLMTHLQSPTARKLSYLFGWGWGWGWGWGETPHSPPLPIAPLYPVPHSPPLPSTPHSPPLPSTPIAPLYPVAPIAPLYPVHSVTPLLPVPPVPPLSSIWTCWSKLSWHIWHLTRSLTPTVN